MSGIEEAYSKYAKGLVEHKLNLALDRLDEHGAVIANLNKAMVGLQHQIDCMRGDLMGKVDQCEEDEGAAGVSFLEHNQAAPVERLVQAELTAV